MATNKSNKSSDRKARSLANKLSSVAKQAKGMGINTSKADSMVAQTKAEGSKAYKGSSFERDFIKANPMAVTDLNPQTPVTLPETPAPASAPSIEEGNAGLSTGMSQFGITYDTNTKQFVSAPIDPNAGLADNLTQMLNSLGAPQDTASIYAKEERDAGLRQKQQEVTGLTSQLNQINSSAQQQQLNLQNQGRGITTDILDTQAYEISRRAAVAALPVQAALQAAQGNLEMAQQHVDKMFQIKSQDAQNAYQYKTKVAETIFNFMNQQEQRRLDMVMREEDRTYQREQANLQQMNEWARLAVTTGQSNLITSFGALDPKSPNFARDFSRLQAKVQQQIEPKSLPTQVVDLGNRKVLINTQTGEVIKDYGGDVVTAEKEAKTEKALGMLQSVNNLLTHTGLQGAVGPNPLARIETSSNPIAGLFPGGPLIAGMFSGNKSEFIAEVDRLANTLTLENMNLLKGPATDKDVEIVNASMSRLKNRDVTESSYVKELQRIQSAMQRIVNKVGITPEQAQYWYGVSPDAVNEADALWDNAQTTIQIAPSLSY